jgi:biopolymer transport protein ExbD
MPQRDDPYLQAARQAGEELTATQRSKVRRLSAPKELDESEQAGELNIVPFLDIITNVMMFVLASLAVTFTVTLAASAPKSGKGRDVPKDILDKSLGLTIVVGTDGYWIKARGGSLGTGCKAGVSGVTIPRISRPAGAGDEGNRAFDADGLRRCLRTIKDGYEAASSERQVLVTAGPNVPFQEIIRVMDAVRGDEAGGCAAACPVETDAKTGDAVHLVCDRGSCAKACAGDASHCSELFPEVVFTVLAGAR